MCKDCGGKNKEKEGLTSEFKWLYENFPIKADGTPDVLMSLLPLQPYVAPDQSHIVQPVVYGALGRAPRMIENALSAFQAWG